MPHPSPGLSAVVTDARSTQRRPAAAVGLCIAIVLGACASPDTAPLRLADASLAQNLSRQLSFGIPLEAGVRVEVSQVRLRLQAGTDHARIDFQARLHDPEAGSERMVRWALETRLRWIPAECAVTLTDVVPDPVTPPAGSAYEAHDRELRWATTLARRLDGLPLWSAAAATAGGCGSVRLRLVPGAAELTRAGA